MKPTKQSSTGLPKNSSRNQSSSYIAPLFEEELVESVETLDLEDQTTVLEAFREQWKQEIAQPVKAEEVKEEKAKTLFLQGVECEKRGEMSEAVHKYTRAMKLVPDIERKVHPLPVPRARSTSRVRTVRKGQHEEKSTSEDNLIHVFEDRISERGYRFGTPEGTKCALNHLPSEILSLIIRYALGDQISVRLLESLSEVSSGMYLLARNNELWRQIHIRSLGCSEVPVQEPEISWRDVYLSYPHLHFEGVYLSKITYIRHGEPGFQDINYRPWHTVVYFRLIRFFPDGSVLMTTSSDNPQSSVNLLKSRGRGDPAICFGTWYQEDADIIMQVRREYPPPPKPKNIRQYTRNAQSKQVPQQEYGVLKHVFRIVFRLTPMRVQGKWSLQWIQNHCSVTYLDGSMVTSDLEAEKNLQEFPPLRFYRVKSYSEGSCSKF